MAFDFTKYKQKNTYINLAIKQILCSLLQHSLC